jgi:hypothetical protein
MMNVYETCHVTRVTETCVCAHAQTHSHLRYRMCLYRGFWRLTHQIGCFN